ncbi:hypothetical protein KVG29_08485 [Caldicoprobacter algeriensis]|uniref:Cas10/Cmr2 second palm domain-containing protein n=1 Tax=Caldicoprobacter algeriensis TaxID=699281 RepID=UPI002079FBB4|nr:hypothetical protein [Caldicoprobacter algeriensis]MCM8901257.1 hypothetical protein [Caldicoprobacter algeriensis]
MSEGLMNILSPKPISFSEFKKLKEELKGNIKGAGNGIRTLLEVYWDIPYYFTDGQDRKCWPSVRDAAHLYVLLNYLLYGKPGMPFDTAKFYRQFFEGGHDKVKEFIADIVAQKPAKLESDVPVDLVLGSIYKIKKYFLENNRIKDIRGASTIIKYMNEELTREFLSQRYIEECALYCGGGNVLMLLPGGQGSEACRQLEECFAKVSLTAKVAFEFIPCTINELFNNYSQKMRTLHERMEERKKTKVYLINPDSDLKEIVIDGKKIDFTHVERTNSLGEVCGLCNVRDAKYIVVTPEGRMPACPSCMRKNMVGKDKAIFYEEYQRVIGCSPKWDVASISDLKDSHGHVAVIYADGNNMGNVVMNISNPLQNMYFSRKVDYTTKRCVYSAIRKVMGDNTRFEAIALGGDDVFIIVPGNVSLEVTSEIIKGFDQSFNYEVTMSAGICIAKHNTPLQSMFQVAQAKLKSAKALARESMSKYGTVDVEVIESNISVDLSKSRWALFPADSLKLAKFIEVIKRMKSTEGINRSQLYKLRYAARELKPYEFQLFYAYQMARLSQDYNKFIAEIFGIDPRRFSGLIENPNANKGKSFVSPWEDIVMLWDCVGGGEGSVS